VDISEISKASHVPVSIIRYYEEKGLTKSVGRKGLRRQFDSSRVSKLE